MLPKNHWINKIWTKVSSTRYVCICKHGFYLVSWFLRSVLQHQRGILLFKSVITWKLNQLSTLTFDKLWTYFGNMVAAIFVWPNLWKIADTKSVQWLIMLIILHVFFILDINQSFLLISHHTCYTNQILIKTCMPFYKNYDRQLRYKTRIKKNKFHLQEWCW